MFLIPTRYILGKPIDIVSKTILVGDWRNRMTFAIFKYHWCQSVTVTIPIDSFLALFTAKPRPQLPPLDGDWSGPVLTI